MVNITEIKACTVFSFKISQRENCKLAWEIGNIPKETATTKAKAKSTILGRRYQR